MNEIKDSAPRTTWGAKVDLQLKQEISSYLQTHSSLTPEHFLRMALSTAKNSETQGDEFARDEEEVLTLISRLRLVITSKMSILAETSRQLDEKRTQLSEAEEASRKVMMDDLEREKALLRQDADRRVATATASVSKMEDDLLAALEQVERKDEQLLKVRKELLKAEERSRDLEAKYEMADEQIVRDRRLIIDQEQRLSKYNFLLEEVEKLREKERNHAVHVLSLDSEIEKRELKIASLKESFESERASFEAQKTSLTNISKLEIENHRLKWDLESAKRSS